MNELVGLTLAGCPALDCGAIKQDLNDRNIAFEVAAFFWMASSCKRNELAAGKGWPG